MKKQAKLLTVARVVLGPKTTSEQLLATTFGELKRVALLRMKEVLPALERFGTFLGLREEDFIYKTKTSVGANETKPASRMSLWRIFSRVSSGFLIVLRRVSQGMMKKAVAPTPAPARSAPVIATVPAEMYVERRVGKMVFRERVVLT